MSKIRNTMAELREKKEMALIAFIMAALPEEELCLDCIKALEQGGCDLLELGVPFSDPLADGEVIERFHHRGVEKGLNLRTGLDFAVKVKSMTAMPLLLFSYFNPIFRMGMDKFISECKSAGIDGLIIPDVPLDEMEIFSAYDIEAIPMVAPSSTDERLAMADALDPAFVYCVSVKGVTGVRSLPENDIKEYLQRVKGSIRSPLALGFGISTPEQVRNFRGHADAIVTGSFLARLIEENEKSPHLIPEIMEKEFAAMKMAAQG